MTRMHNWAWLGLWVAVALGAPSGARAFEFFDGRLQVHGFYEAQVRSIVRDLDFSDDWDLTQWWNVLNIEVEGEIAPEGWGPFDLVTAFGRVEVRYDCVWTRGCGLLRSADAYGRRARRLPKRLSDGRRSGLTFQLDDGDRRRYTNIPIDRLSVDFIDLPESSRKPSPLWDVPGFTTLFGIAGLDGELGSPDDPALNVFDPWEDCRYGVRRTKGDDAGVDSQVLVLTVDRHDCKIDPLAPLGIKPNPFRAGDFNPLIGQGGSSAFPLRPAPELPAQVGGPADRAHGIWYPNAKTAQLIRDGKFDHFDQNFRQSELAWNRGASQQDEKELKEAYLDIEMFDSRLWLRIGKQQIVWGKTELFRTTDQFNPQDLALGSLTSLEESRIALWAVRGVWSFFEVGPLDDVRLELAANLDDFEPNDFGRCGEPYTPLAACDLTYGLFVHGNTGVAIAGVVRPPKPWNSWKGLEVGARLEFRLGRFSFALTDFWGYDDSPYVDRFFRYSRNVDPITGRPRHTMATGPCGRGSTGEPLEAACLIGENIPGMEPDFQFPANSAGRNALEYHSINLQLFTLICSTSVGFSDLDRSVCGQSVFNSRNQTGGATIGTALSQLIAGDPLGLVLPALVPGLSGPCSPPFTSLCNPLIPLAVDPSDGPFLTVPQAQAAGLTPGPSDSALYAFGLQRTLTAEQQALLGCGPFYGTYCDGHGIDLLNAEGSALMQSWPGFEGTSDPWDSRDASKAQPGTVGFRGGPVCTRYEGGRLFILPGCRGLRDLGPDGAVGGGDDVFDDGYDPNVDGTTTGPPAFGSNPGARTHPFTGQPFRSEMAVASWNLMVLLVSLSSLGADPNNPSRDEFTGLAPFRTDGCSFAKPHYCGNVNAFDSISGVQRNTIRAGGNFRFGRRDLFWSGGSDLALRFEKRNVLGLSADWAEDVTKTNWGFEFTWIKGEPATNNDEVDGLSKVDTFNLTISADRPTFVNFLNQNRTLFLNTQWFLQYIDDYVKGMPGSGPFNVLATFTVQTGYFQDRLNPAVTFVYDFRSNSGAVLPEIGYRFTENFSATFGLAIFNGREEPKKAALTPTSIDNRVQPHAYKSFAENALAVIRERDEIFLTVRYTF